MHLQMIAYLVMERFLTYKNVQQVRAAYSEWFDKIMANYDESDDLVLANRIRMSAFYASSFSKLQTSFMLGRLNSWMITIGEEFAI